jgi:hypothetical protein
MEKLFGNLAGGWKLADFQEAKLPPAVEKGFNETAGKLIGVGYKPVLYLGSQLVNGINHAVLCTARPAVKDPVTKLAVVYLHEALGTGAFELLSVKTLDLGI